MDLTKEINKILTDYCKDVDTSVIEVEAEVASDAVKKLKQTSPKKKKGKKATEEYESAFDGEEKMMHKLSNIKSWPTPKVSAPSRNNFSTGMQVLPRPAKEFTIKSIPLWMRKGESFSIPKFPAMRSAVRKPMEATSLLKI